jgi:hypothetical protein
MSTLTVTNIKATGETASRAVSGVAAAWVNFDNQGTATINGSYNISSCTDTATGRFRSNFTSNMADSVYCCSGMEDDYHLTSDSNDDKTPTGEAHLSFYVSGTGGNRTMIDVARNTVSYHGDLA